VILAGLLTSRAIVLERSSALDDLGRPTDSWSQTGLFRCQLEDQGVSETDIGQGPAISRRFLLRARWQTVRAVGLTESHRVRVGARLLKIMGITDKLNKHQEAEIDCVQVEL